MSRTLLPVLLVPLLVLSGTAGAAAAAPPQPPAAYYGHVTVGGAPAPDGTVVTARVDGEVRDRLATRDGTYGGPYNSDEHLTVNATDGATVVFYVGGTRAASVPYRSADFRQVNLSVDSVDARATTTADDADGGTGSSGGTGGTDADGSTDGTDAGTGGTTLASRTTVAPDDAVTVSTRVAPDAPANVSVEGASAADVTLSAVSVDATRETALDLSIAASADAPSAATERSDALAYLSVDHDVPEDALDGVSFSFAVGAARVEDAGGPSAVALYRYHDGAWRRLPTDPVGRRGDAYRFRATSPGLSVFAVGTQSAQTTQATRTTAMTTQSAQTTQAAQSTRPTDTEETTDSGGVPGFTALAALVALGSAALLGRRR